MIKRVHEYAVGLGGAQSLRHSSHSFTGGYVDGYAGMIRHARTTLIVPWLMCLWSVARVGAYIVFSCRRTRYGTALESRVRG